MANDDFPGVGVPGFRLQVPGGVQPEPDPVLRAIPDLPEIDAPETEEPVPVGDGTGPEPFPAPAADVSAPEPLPDRVQGFFEAEDPVDYILRLDQNRKRAKAINALEGELNDLGLVPPDYLGLQARGRAERLGFIGPESTPTAQRLATPAPIAQQQKPSSGFIAPQAELTPEQQKEAVAGGPERIQKQMQQLHDTRETLFDQSVQTQRQLEQLYGFRPEPEPDGWRENYRLQGMIEAEKLFQQDVSAAYLDLKQRFDMAYMRALKAVQDPSVWGPKYTRMTHYTAEFAKSAGNMGFGISRGVIEFAEIVGELTGLKDQDSGPSWARAALNDLNKAFDEAMPVDSYWAETHFALTDLTRAGGSMSVFLMGGMIANTLTKSAEAGGWAAGLMGSMVEADALYQEAERYDATAWERYFNYLAGLGIGATEGLVISRMLGRANVSSGGGVMRSLMNANSDAMSALIDNFGQEVLQSLLHDVSAKVSFDPNRSLNVVQAVREGLAGGGAGYLLQLALGIRTPKAVDQQAVEQELTLIEIEKIEQDIRRGMAMAEFRRLQEEFDAADQTEERISFEMQPGEGAPNAALTERLNALPEEDRIDIADAITGTALERATEFSGIENLNTIVHGVGVWDGVANRSATGQVVATPEQARTAAAYLGYVLQQTEVWVNRVKPLTKSAQEFAVDILDLGKAALADGRRAHEVFEKIADADPTGLIGGYQNIVNEDGEPGIRILVNKDAIAAAGLTAQEAQVKIRAALEGEINDALADEDIDLDVEFLGAEIDIVRNDWTEKPNGEDYLQVIEGQEEGRTAADINRVGQEFAQTIEAEIRAAEARTGQDAKPEDVEFFKPPIRMTDRNGLPFRVFVDPTAMQVETIMNQPNRLPQFRYLLLNDGTVLAWDAHRAVHDDVMRGMGVTFADVKARGNLYRQAEIDRLLQGEAPEADVETAEQWRQLNSPEGLQPDIEFQRVSRISNRAGTELRVHEDITKKQMETLLKNSGELKIPGHELPPGTLVGLRYMILKDGTVIAWPLDKAVHFEVIPELGLTNDDIAVRAAAYSQEGIDEVFRMADELKAGADIEFQQAQRPTLQVNELPVDQTYGAQTYEAIEDGKVVGSMSVRRFMTDNLESVGGMGLDAGEGRADEIIYINGPIDVQMALLEKAGLGREAMPAAVKEEMARQASLSPQEREANLRTFMEGSQVVDESGEPLVVHHVAGSTHTQFRPTDFTVFDTTKGDLGTHFGTLEQAQDRQRSGGILPNMAKYFDVYLSIKNPLRLVDEGAFHSRNIGKQLVEKGILTAEQLADITERVDKAIADGGSSDAIALDSKLMQDAIKAAGYDGVVYLNRREGLPFEELQPTEAARLNSLSDEEFQKEFPQASDSWVVFDSNQVKSVLNQGTFDAAEPDIMFQRGREPKRTLSPEGRAAWAILEKPDLNPEEIKALPIVKQAIDQMQSMTPVEAMPGYMSDQWVNGRVFDFRGEQVTGYEAAIPRFEEDAKTLAARELGIDPYEVAYEKKAVILLGPPAAGKSTIANLIALDMKAAIPDADEVKKTLPEYNGGVGAAAVHEESSAIMKIVQAKMIDAGMNLVIPKVGDNPAKMKQFVRRLQEQGYKVDVALMDVNAIEAFKRMIRRFVNTGRLVDPDYALFAGEKPPATFEELKKEKVADGYAKILSPEGNDPVVEEAGTVTIALKQGQILAVGSVRNGRTGRGDGSTGRSGQPAQSEAQAQPAVRNAPGERSRPEGGIADTGQPAVDTSISQMSNNLTRLLQLVVRQGRLATKSRDVIGQYQRSTGEIRMRNMADLSTRVHEAGHALNDARSAILDQFVKDHVDVMNAIAERWYAGETPTPISKRREGFAEFFRVYTLAKGFGTQGADAIPGLAEANDAFDALLEAEAPQVKRGLDTLRSQFDAWLQLPDTQALKSMLVSTQSQGIIGTAIEQIRQRAIDDSPRELARGTGSWLEDKFAHSYSVAIDQGEILKRTVEGLLNVSERNQGFAADLPHHEDPYVLYTLARQNMGSAMVQMKYGIRGYHSADTVSRPLRDGILVAMGEEAGTRGRPFFDQNRLDDFNAYLVARRALGEWDRYDAGEIPFPPLGAEMKRGGLEQAIKDFEAKYGDAFRDGAEIIYEYNQALWKKIYDAGLIDEEMYAAGAAKKDYVPLMRDMSDRGRAFGESVITSGKSSIIKRFRGSSRDIINPLDAIMNKTFAYERAIATNDVRKALVKLGNKVGNGSARYVVPISAHDMKGTTVNVLEVMRSALKGADIDPVDAQEMYMMLESSFDDTATVKVFRSTVTSERGENIVFYWDQGQRKAMQVADGEFGEDLMRVLAGVGHENMPLFVDSVAMTSNLFRAGITNWPDFLVVNYFRDQLQTWLQQEDFVPFVTGFKGMIDEVRSAKAAQSYNVHGGIMGGMTMASLHEARVLKDIRALEKKGYLGEVVGDVKAIVRGRGLQGLVSAIGRVTELSETGTRVGLFDKAMKKYMADGLSEYEAGVAAAYIATDNMNFGRSGSRMLALRRLVPFLGAQIQGLDKMVRTLTAAEGGRRRIGWYRFLMEVAVKDLNGTTLNAQEKKHVRIARKAWGKMVGLSFLYMALTAWQEDDPDYQQISTYLKATGTPIMLGEDGKFLWLPKPFEWALMGNALEAAYKAQHGDGRAWDRFKEGLGYTLIPPTEIPILRTGYELAYNIDTFRNMPIEPVWVQRFDGFERYNAYTSELAKRLAASDIGKSLNLSPLKIDHFINNMFTSAGRDLLGETNRMLNQNRPKLGLEDHFFTRRWIRDSKRGSTVVKDFFEYASGFSGDLTRSYATYKRILDKGRELDAADFLSKLTLEEQAYAILNTHFEAKHKRLHPMRRAADYYTVISGMRGEINSGDGLESTEFKDDPAEIVMTARAKATVEDMLQELAIRQLRNALVLMKDRGYTNREYLPVDEPFDLLAQYDQRVADELERRLTKAQVYDWETVRDNWPDLRERLLTEGDEATLNDLLVGAKR